MGSLSNFESTVAMQLKQDPGQLAEQTTTLWAYAAGYAALSMPKAHWRHQNCTVIARGTLKRPIATQTASKVTRVCSVPGNA